MGKQWKGIANYIVLVSIDHLKLISFFLRFYLFTFREKEREGERGERHRCVRDTWISCFLHALNWGPGPQPRHLP